MNTSRPPISSFKEPTILEKVAGGDQSLYTRLVILYWPKVFKHALSFVKSAVIAEELTQDVFVLLWMKRLSLSEVRNFDNYLFIVSRNLMISHNRRKILETVSLDSERLTELVDIPDGQLEFRELVEFMNKGIMLLQEPSRSVYCLSLIEGRDIEQISLELGVAKPTVRRHLFRAVGFIRKYLRRMYNSNL